MDASKAQIGEINTVGDTLHISLPICKIKPSGVAVAEKVDQRCVSRSCHLQYNKRASTSPSSSDQQLNPSIPCHASGDQQINPSIPCHASGDQQLNPSIPCHAIFIFLDPLLLGVVQIEYQNKQKTPCDTHPVQMQTFLVTICIYTAVFGIKIFSKHARSGFQGQILSFVLLVAGSLSSAALLSILLHRILLWLVLTIWGSIPIIMGRHLLKNSVYRIFGLVEKLNLKNKFSTMVSVFCRKAQGSNNNPTDQV